MCGIAGRLNFAADEPVSSEAVRAMCATLRHRGPDDEGVYVDGPLGIGMRRLSIIDVVGGRQPIRNEDGSIWLVYNGEIYNFHELRSFLERQGHTFYTATDSEVLVHLYEEFGEDFLTPLAGMFALALWDRREKKLVLARDRLGIKPLYYSVTGGRLRFASELKALLADGVERDIDLQALHDYLSLNYIPGERSIFQGVHKLPPGHLLICANGTARIRRYWSLDYAATDGPSDRTEQSYREELHALLKTVVRQHLIADVPLGVLLSGGLDSGSLVALTREVSPRPVRTFSIGFEDPSYDELAGARAVARRFGTEHHERVVRPDAVRLLPSLVRFFDEPFADSSALALYSVCQLARGHVTVALSGEGGDEVFAGYETYAAYRAAELYKRLPSAIATRLVPALVRHMPVSHRRVSLDYRAKRFIDGALLSPIDGHFHWKLIFSEDAKEALYAGGKNGFESPLALYRRTYDTCSAADPLAKLQHVDLAIYLPDDILVKADRMSMANSLELRVPFLDHRVVQFAATLPTSLKLRGFTKKYILKRLMAPRLPTSSVHGRKRGFNVPVPLWLHGELRDLVHDVLGPDRIRRDGFFDPEVVETMIKNHETRRLDLSRNIWGLLVFALWLDEQRQAAPPVTPSGPLPASAPLL
jgi:asparagine synthase (glutamine-hydrolysing)